MLLVCKSCHTLIRLEGEQVAADSYPCTECAATMENADFLEDLEGSRDVVNDARWYTADEYWKRVLGRGDARERANPQLVKKLLAADGIILNDGVVRQAGSPAKTIVDTLTVGKRAYHFCASSLGAMIIKVTEEKNENKKEK